MAPDAEPVIVVAGHICLDVHVEFGGRPRDFADLLAPGKLIEVGPAQFATGGPVANTGLVLHRLGCRVRLVGKVGADALGRATLDVLRAHDEHLADEMIVSADDYSSYTIVVSPPGTDRCFLHFPGANHTFRAADIRDEQLAGAAWLHFGYPPLMRSIYERDGAELVTIFERAHAAGLVTSLDMAVPDPNAPSGRVDWPKWLANVLPHVDVFLPSLDETLFMLDRERFKTFSGAKDQSIDEALPREVAGRLLELGAAVVGLKLGDAGFYVRSQDNPHALGQKRGHSTFLDSSRRDPQDPEKSRMSPFLAQIAGFDVPAWTGCEVRTPCFEVEVCGTTGAGDATIAGFIAAMLKGLGPQQAAKMAVAIGACSVEAPDASSGVPTWETVVTRVQSGWSLRSA